MIKHFVSFYSPGTFTDEVSDREISEWSVTQALQMRAEIKERHGATPYGFTFYTKERGPNDLDSKITKRSSTYYIGGKIETIEEVFARNLPSEDILRWNMENNGFDRIWINEGQKGYRVTRPLRKGDTVLEVN